MLTDTVSSRQVEVRNPKPHVKKIVETRYTTIRYPVFITQVIKPLLTQVETKVRPLFFTKTINRYTTVKFTVTGIGQVTHTTVKFEKEYITRCNKKGYDDHHRRDASDGPVVDVEAAKPSAPTYRTSAVEGPPGIPYDDAPLQPSDDGHASLVQPTPVQAGQVTAPSVPPVGFRRPGLVRLPPPPPPPRRPVGPRPLGFYGALAQLGLGSQQSPRTEPYLPHPPLPQSPAVAIG